MSSQSGPTEAKGKPQAGPKCIWIQTSNALLEVFGAGGSCDPQIAPAHRCSHLLLLLPAGRLLQITVGKSTRERIAQKWG